MTSSRPNPVGEREERSDLDERSGALDAREADLNRRDGELQRKSERLGLDDKRELRRRRIKDRVSIVSGSVKSLVVFGVAAAMTAGAIDFVIETDAEKKATLDLRIAEQQQVAATEAKINSRRNAIEARFQEAFGISELGASFSLEGLEFHSVNGNGNLDSKRAYLEDDNKYYYRADFGGTYLYLGVGTQEPHMFRGWNQALEKGQNFKLKENATDWIQEQVEIVIERKAGVEAQIKKLGGSSLYDGFQFEGVTFKPDEGNGYFPTNKDWFTKDGYYVFSVNGSGQGMGLGVKAEFPHKIGVWKGEWRNLGENSHEEALRIMKGWISSGQ